MAKDIVYKPGDLVERLIYNGYRKYWQGGYTVIEKPDNVSQFANHIYISRPYTAGFSEYVVGVHKENLRFSLENNPQID